MLEHNCGLKRLIIKMEQFMFCGKKLQNVKRSYRKNVEGRFLGEKDLEFKQTEQTLT